MKHYMKDIRSYFEELLKNDNNVYSNGKWGQFVNGKQAFDCVCVIKAVNWEVPINTDITADQYSYIANSKTWMPDVSIPYFYNNASVKGPISAINTAGDYFSFVYAADFGHIGLYDPYYKTVYEMCAGQTNKVRKQALALYPDGYWAWFSNGFYFYNSRSEALPTVSTSPIVAEDTYYNNKVSARFKVFAEGKQVGAFTVYKNALKKADATGGVVYDSCDNMMQIYPEVKEDTKTYYVQAGAYSVRANADKQISNIKAKTGIGASIKEADKMFKVLCGPYATMDQAYSIVSSLKYVGIQSYIKEV